MGIKNKCCIDDMSKYNFTDIKFIDNCNGPQIYIPENIQKTEQHFRKMIALGVMPFKESDLDNRDKETDYIGYFNNNHYFVKKLKLKHDAHS